MARANNTLQDLHNSSDDMKVEFNVIVLLFIQSNFEFKNMLTSIDVKFIFDSACLSASLGDKGLFISANIL